jgi:DNA repair protein RecO (recombination protein O)
VEAWADDALLLAVRRHGEADAIVELFTAARGRHAAVVKGGAGRRLGPVLQPGATLAVEWRARLAEHLGVARVEPLRDRAGAIMADAGALAALSSAAALLVAFTAEREPHPALHAATEALFDRLAAGPGWEGAYAAWEVGLLAELGFGLDLSSCALSGATEGLAWVSPRTGRAVSAAAGAPWAGRLLPLPGFLTGSGPADAAGAAAALRLTGHFLDRLAVEGFGAAAAPPARARLVARLAAQAGAALTPP